MGCTRSTSASRPTGRPPVAGRAEVLEALLEAERWRGDELRSERDQERERSDRLAGELAGPTAQLAGSRADRGGGDSQAECCPV
jgi:hypothetical protein